MSSYSNYYNSYRYSNSNNGDKDNLNGQYAGTRQPIQPPHGYMEASYDWNNQQLGNSRAYSSAGNDVYSHSQDYSSHSGDLSHSINPYSQAARTQENKLESSGLNSLVYASTLESAVRSDTNQSVYNMSRQDGRDSYQAHTAATSHDYSSQPSNQTPVVAGRTTGGYNRQSQRSPYLSQPNTTSQAQRNQQAANNMTRQQPAKVSQISQPQPRPSPQVNSQAQSQWQSLNQNTPPTSHALADAPSNARSLSQQSNGYISFTSNTPSSHHTAHNTTAAVSNAPTAANIPRPSTPPTMTHKYSNGQSGVEAGSQVSPPKVQFINPNELYNQQYILAQERARAAEAEAAEARRQQEAEAQAQAQAEAAAAAAMEVDTAAGTKSTPTKKNTAKRRAPKKKAAEKAADQTSAPELNLQDDNDGMALEMRLMLEKLRGMRAKDPSLFSKLWDDFKKAPPAKEDVSSSKGKKSAKSKSSTTEPAAATTTAATGTPDSASKWKGIPQSGLIDGLPDLGKFPALRRRRKDKNEEQSTPNKDSGTAAVTQVNVDSMLNQQPNVAQQPTSSKSAAQDATWPAATQQKLAQAASDYLSKDLANKDKQCSPESLMLLLRNNPTYPDLCAQLESRGFALDRQALARFLLAAVPALISNNAASQEPKKGETNGNAPSQSVQTSASGATGSAATQPAPQAPPLPGTEAAPKPKSKPKTKPQAPKPPTLAGPLQAPSADVLVGGADGGATSVPLANLETNAPAPSRNKTSSSRKSAAQPPPPSVLGPKAEKARKRLFSEIVDLSLLSSDEDEPDEESGEGTFSRPSKLLRLDNAPTDFPTDPSFNQDSMDIDEASPRLFESERSKSPITADSQIAEPEIEFDPDDESCLRSIRALPNIAKPIQSEAALKRVYYNPKSVARDILITAGRHPSERPLNYHLMKFPEIFAGVNSKTDLETFRWDLVDPGGPPRPIVEFEDILAEPPRVPRKRRRDRQSRENTDKGSPTSDARTQFPPDALHAHQSGNPSSVSTPQARKVMAGAPTSGPGSGRRGRPPGSKNKKPTKAALKAAAAPAAKRNAQVAVPAPLPVPEPSYPIFTCEWASCPAQLHDVHTLERHVDKVHVPGQTRCQWNNCPNSDTQYDGESLKMHLHQAHIQALAWKYGDGPPVNGTVIELDRYLNANGSIITPDANKAGESDSLIFPVEQTPIRAFNKLHGNDKPAQKAQEVLSAVRRRRKQVGIGLEQEGCEFSTPQRNKVFVNDEEFYQVITDDEEDGDNWFRQDDSS